MALLIQLLVALLSAGKWVPLCDWHHHHHYGSSGGSADLPDPFLDAFLVGVAVVVLCSLGLLLFCSPFLVVWRRRSRHIFWVVPIVNLLLYFGGAALRTYPGGFWARFRPPGLWYTLGELALVLLLSLLIAIVTALVRWSIRKVRSLRGGKQSEPALPPVIPKSTEGPPSMK